MTEINFIAMQLRRFMKTVLLFLLSSTLSKHAKKNPQKPQATPPPPQRWTTAHCMDVTVTLSIVTWRSLAGFQSISYRTRRDAPTRLSPTPPALELNRNMSAQIFGSFICKMSTLENAIQLPMWWETTQKTSQFSLVSRCLGKHTCVPIHFSEVFSVLPFTLFQCWSGWWHPFSSFQGRLLSVSSFYAAILQVINGENSRKTAASTNLSPCFILCTSQFKQRNWTK